VCKDCTHAPTFSHVSCRRCWSWQFCVVTCR